jgi:hypothetical protein
MSKAKGNMQMKGLRKKVASLKPLIQLRKKTMIILEPSLTRVFGGRRNKLPDKAQVQTMCRCES